MAHIVEPHHRQYGEELYAHMKTNPVIRERHVRGAIELIEYFKAHTRKVYSQLRGFEKTAHENAVTDKECDLAQPLMTFVKDRGGYWEGTTSELLDIFKARAVPDLPGGTGPFGKLVRKIAKDESIALVLQEGDRSKEHIIKLSLPTPGTVGDAETSSADSTDSKRAEDNAAASKESRIAEAIERLFEEHQEYGEPPDPDAVAVDLFWYQYLDFIPEDDEVERVLKEFMSTRKEDVM